MASVFQREGREGWFVKWTDAYGKQQRKKVPARTKNDARRIAADLERQAERQRLGLEALPTDSTMTLAELVRWWVEQRRCSDASREADRGRLEKHVCAHALGAAPLSRVTSEAIEALLVDLERAGAAPASVNRLRSSLHATFARARKMKLWTGPNPIEDVDVRRVPKRIYSTLKAEEVPQLLPHVDPEWQDLFAAALWTGMRKGELCGLLKSDVDLPGRTLYVARSYDQDTTKGGHADALPIAEPLVPYLERAIAGSPSQWVFPAPDGSMRTEESDPQKVLRTALARAGLVDGWDHVCRKCGHVEKAPDSALRGCPVCPPLARCARCANGKTTPCPNADRHEKRKLWPKAIPRQMRFHDLRHTTATMLLRAGVDAHRVQRILRHASINTTLGTYGHLNVEDLRDAVAALPAGPLPVVEEARQPLPLAASAGAQVPEGAQLGPKLQRAKEEAGSTGDFPNESGLRLRGLARVHPCSYPLVIIRRRAPRKGRQTTP